MPKGFADPRYVASIKALTAARSERGWTQDRLARELGRHQQYVSRYESGQRRLDFIEFVDVAAVLGIDASQLVRDVPPPPRS